MAMLVITRGYFPIFFYENDLFHLDELYELHPGSPTSPTRRCHGHGGQNRRDRRVRRRNARPAGTRGALGPRWRYPRILAGKGSKIKPGWWFQPLWKIFGMIIPNIWKNKKCSKPPTRNLWSTSKICLMCIFENDQNLRSVNHLSHCLSSYPHTGPLSWWHLSKRDPCRRMHWSTLADCVKPLWKHWYFTVFGIADLKMTSIGLWHGQKNPECSSWFLLKRAITGWYPPPFSHTSCPPVLLV